MDMGIMGIPSMENNIISLGDQVSNKVKEHSETEKSKIATFAAWLEDDVSRELHGDISHFLDQIY